MWNRLAECEKASNYFLDNNTCVYSVDSKYNIQGPAKIMVWNVLALLAQKSPSPSERVRSKVILSLINLLCIVMHYFYQRNLPQETIGVECFWQMWLPWLWSGTFLCVIRSVNISCNYWSQWFSDDPRYTSNEEHLRRTGRHKNPLQAGTPPEQWKMWDISFPDTDDEN